MQTSSSDFSHMLLDAVRHLVWAHQQLAPVLLQCNADDFNRNLGGSFPSLRSCLHHIASAEKIWLQRILGNPHQNMPPSDPHELPELLVQRWLQGSMELLQVLELKITEAWRASIQYKSLNGIEHTNPLFEIVYHICQHSAFHRGQLVHMLRQLGLNQLPATDYIVYTRTISGA